MIKVIIVSKYPVRSQDIEVVASLNDHHGLAQAIKMYDAEYILTEIPEQQNFVVIKKRNIFKFIPVAQVLYFKSEDKYIEVHHEGGVDLIDGSLKNLELKYSGLFVRIHRKTLVSLARVSELHKHGGGYTIKLHGTEDVMEVSRRQVKSLLEVLGIK